ncbi:hypothetical protein B1R32_101167 [Abditibacterium utsteinense]|uniref:Uncharacterized protein n=1 Tax=Abditibacterium utsteinense TaxID=1960156 RepID=A0A2S8SX98_9BACT|nr:hypothetical protein [Abditibacterium utsteinense]PQV65425.1 hypothetical protein B1R32_101167 [Abditibacterium utsteinense]
MKYIWRGVYSVYFAVPLAYSISLHLLYRRASLLLGYPPEYMVNSPQSFGSDAVFDRLDNLTMILGFACWIVALFGSFPILISLFWPVSFRSRWLRLTVFSAFVLAWGYWATDAKGAWYLD